MTDEVIADISSVGIIVYRTFGGANQYLLLRKRCKIWEPPKGRMNPGETPFQAALRETFEEASLSGKQLTLVHSFKPINVRYQGVSGKAKIARFWLAQVDLDAEVQISHEHEEFKWCNFSEVIQIVRPTFGEGFEIAESFIKTNNILS